jgi:hypothetical protein
MLLALKKKTVSKNQLFFSGLLDFATAALRPPQNRRLRAQTLSGLSNRSLLLFCPFHLALKSNCCQRQF